MSGVLGVLAGALGGGAAGWLMARRPPRTKVAPLVSPHLLPDPALDWLRRAHGALGVWIAELDPREEGPRAERIVDAERLAIAQIVAVDRRLERARDEEQTGVERTEAGTLVFHAAGGSAAALLLPHGAEAARGATGAAAAVSPGGVEGERPAPGRVDLARLAQAEQDLRRLLEGVRRRPQAIALAQAQPHAASLESAGSVGLRLAYYLERLLDAEVVVAAAETGGVRVIGVSGRADRRILDSILPAGSDLARLARGEVDEPDLARAAPARTTGDPLGGAVADRRHRPGAALLLPIRVGTQPVGAVAIWLPRGGEPAGAMRTELTEALVNAAPRIARAVEADRRQQAATVDPLTGLRNRRGLDEVLTRHGMRTGALIYADLDRFKLLNDTLGHPAGDAALAHFAHLLREQIRDGDVAARIGGEEFAIWLPEAGLDLGARVAERIRLKLGTTPWDWQGRSWPLSASFGVAACPDTSRSLENLPAQADAALYVAKKSGRNRVERAGAVPGGGGAGPAGQPYRWLV